jgi:hypothetical protein
MGQEVESLNTSPHAINGLLGDSQRDAQLYRILQMMPDHGLVHFRYAEPQKRSYRPLIFLVFSLSVT